jgi:hypothetical protein
MADEHLLERKGRERFKLEVDLASDICPLHSETADEEAVAWKQSSFTV